MRDSVRRLFLNSLALLVAASPAIAASPHEKPNILLILSDDHSAPQLGCYGDPNARTPHFDRFAAEGMRFDRAYTTSPQCMPSRASMLTGRSPVDIGMSRFSAALPPDIVTAPDLLKTAGYVVGVGGRDFHLDGWSKKGPPHLAEIDRRHGRTKFSSRMDFVKQDHFNEQIPSERILAEFLDQRGDRPFFFWLNFYEPHRPWRPAKRPDPASIILPPDLPDYPSVREDLANFYGYLTEMDTKFGAVMALLEERGLKDNTLVVFVGDNGASWFRGKGTLYERGCHVPLLVRWPGRVAPESSTSSLVSGEDITPTLLAAAEVSADPAMTGRSFLPLLRNQPYEGRDAVFTERGAHGVSLPRDTIAFDLTRAITTDRYRLIYNALWQLPYRSVDIESYDQEIWRDLKRRHDAGTLPEPFARLFFAPSRPMFELFDLQADPYELNNLAGRPEVADLEKNLKERLDEWMILQDDFVPLSLSR
jgi:N-sulfoglucosamine sulfohydrolase